MRGEDRKAASNVFARQGVENDVDTLAASGLHDFVGESEGARVQDVGHAHRLQVRALFRRAGGREYFRSGLLSQLHGGQTHAACRGVDEHALSAGKFRKMVERIVGRKERDRNRGRLTEAESGRLGHDRARVRGGEGAEAGARHGDHFVAGFHIGYIRPDGGNRSRAFGAEGDWAAGIYARGIHHIAKVQARGIYADFDFARLRLRTRGCSQDQILEISGARDIQAERIRDWNIQERGARGFGRARHETGDVSGSFSESNFALGAWERQFLGECGEFFRATFGIEIDSRAT